MTHLIVRITVFPVLEYVARCGVVSADPKRFAKVKAWTYSTLDGVTCPGCLGERTCAE